MSIDRAYTRDGVFHLELDGVQGVYRASADTLLELFTTVPFKPWPRYIIERGVATLERTSLAGWREGVA